MQLYLFPVCESINQKSLQHCIPESQHTASITVHDACLTYINSYAKKESPSSVTAESTS